MSLQFVFTVERRLAHGAFVGLLTRVDVSMQFEVVLPPEELLAHLALEPATTAVRGQMTPQVALARKHLLAVRAGEVVSGGLQVVLQGLGGRVFVDTFDTLVDSAVLLGALLRQEAVGVLVHAQVIERGEALATEMAAIAQLLLVALDVLQKCVELWERLRTAFHHTLVNLLILMLGHVGLELEVGAELAGAELAQIGAVNEDDLLGLQLVPFILTCGRQGLGLWGT